MKILVIDDKQWNREAAVEQLSAEHELTVYDGTEYQISLGMDLADYDVILSDLWMPGKDGGEEEPIGASIAFRVLSSAARYPTPVRGVVIYTDTHHHFERRPYFKLEEGECFETKQGVKLFFYEDDGGMSKRLINPSTGEIISRQTYYTIPREEKERLGIRPIKEWGNALAWYLEKAQA